MRLKSCREMTDAIRDEMEIRDGMRYPRRATTMMNSPATAMEDYIAKVDELASDPNRPVQGLSISRPVVVQSQKPEQAPVFEGAMDYEAVRMDFTQLSTKLHHNPGLLQVKDDEQRTLLHWAADANDVVAVQALIAAGVDIDARDVDGSTALGYAASSNLRELSEILIAAGSDPTRAVVISEDVVESASQCTRDADMKTWWIEREVEWAAAKKA